MAATTTTPIDPNAIYDEADVSAFMRLSRSGLRARRNRGDSVPDWFRIGTRVVYRGSDVLAWVEREATAAHRARGRR